LSYKLYESLIKIDKELSKIPKIKMCPNCRQLFCHRKNKRCPSCNILLIHPGEWFSADDKGYFWSNGGYNAI